MVIQTIDPFLVVIEGAEVELFLSILDFYPALLIACGHDEAISTKGDGCDREGVIFDFSYYLLGVGVYD